MNDDTLFFETCYIYSFIQSVASVSLSDMLISDTRLPANMSIAEVKHLVRPFNRTKAPQSLIIKNNRKIYANGNLFE